MSEHTTAASVATTAQRSADHLVLRFRPSERHMHWAVAMPFMVCYTTALVLIFVYNPNPSLPFRRVVSWAHRLSGLCLLMLPLATIVRHRRDALIHAHNVRRVWTWSRDDLAWLLRIGPASVCRSVSLPHQGKFNAGEKINFMTLTCTYPLLLMTGLVIWFGGVPYLSWLAHFSLAALATPLIAGHIFMATVNPDTRPGLSGVITGFVDRHWARHHYHHWYQELYGDADARAAAASAAGPAVPGSCAAQPALAVEAEAAPADDLKPPEGRQVRPDAAHRRGRGLFGVIEAGAAMAARTGGADAPAAQ
ncbi:MAG: cytochrome b/b6 domain-containing protein [Bacteroidales bacterium]